MPSSAIFFTSDPENPFGWNRPERELASGHPAHLAVRGFRLGLITATCYEYRQNYSNTEDSPQHLHSARLVGVSLLHSPNRINYNLRAAFFGNRDDLPAFYEMLNSAAPSLSRSD
ncbi:MAG TPA: hypothetical protein VGO27_07045 [Candidatus Acidoferrum sp.]|nr:hypothetical protein [Candidatus Acidoferrum sp.]